MPSFLMVGGDSVPLWNRVRCASPPSAFGISSSNCLSRSSARTRISVTICTALVSFAIPAWADFSGTVVAIHDGDTLTVLVDRKQVKVRLADIDAPEAKQAFGTRSRQALATLCHQKPAQVVDK